MRQTKLQLSAEDRRIVDEIRSKGQRHAREVNRAHVLSCLDRGVAEAQIMEVLEVLREHRSLAVVLITHDLSIAASRVERVYVMYAGKIVEELPVAELARGSKMPYTQALLRAVPSAVGARGVLPMPLVGAPPDPQFMPLGCRFHPRCPRAAEVCAATEPELVEVGPAHKSACLFPGPDEFVGAAISQAATPLASE